MQEKKKKEKHKKTKILETGLIILIAIVLGLTVFFLTYSKVEKAPTGNSETVSYSALICERNHQEETDILKTDNATSVREELKVTYRSDKLNDLFFSYQGNYPDKKLTEKAETRIHGDYYQYIGKLGIGTSDYANTYNFSGNQLIMNLMASAEKINPSSLKLFFLDPGTNIQNMKAQDFQKIYEAQGFNCKTSN